MLEVVLPVAFISRAIAVDVNAVAVSFIVLPLAFKYISIDVPKLSLPTSFVCGPLAFVPGAVWPYLNSVAVLYLTQPLTFVNSAVLEHYLVSLLQLNLASGQLLFEQLLILLLLFHLSKLLSDLLPNNAAFDKTLNANYRFHISLEMAQVLV